MHRPLACRATQEYARCLGRFGENALGGGVSEASSPREIQKSAELPGSPSPADALDESGFHIVPERRAIVVPSSGQTERSTDVRDLLIAQQVRLVDELERKVDMLEAMLHAQRRDGRSDGEERNEERGGKSTNA